MSEKSLTRDEITRLPKSLVQAGVPIEFPIYDIKGQLLMAKGSVISTEEQLENLFARGLFLHKKTIEQLPVNQPVVEKPKEYVSNEPEEKLVDLKLNNIALGEIMYLSPLSNKTKYTKYTVKFLGGVKKGSIICSTPMLDNKLVYIKPDSGFLIHIINGVEIYNFTSILTASYDTPFPHMHLKFPTSVYKKVLSEHPYAQASIICSMTNQINDEFSNIKFSGRMTHISIAGVKLESNKQLGEIDDEIECRFKLKVFKKEIFYSLLCVLKKLQEPSESDKNQKYRYDLTFKSISFEEKVMLQKLYLRLFGKRSTQQILIATTQNQSFKNEKTYGLLQP